MTTIEATKPAFPTVNPPSEDGKCDPHFGRCPECPCGTVHEHRNSGRCHFFFCPVHKTVWCVGSNLFSDWKHEDELDWDANDRYFAKGGFRPVQSIHCKNCWPSLPGEDQQLEEITF